MRIKNLLKHPVFWSILIFLVSQLLTFVVITRENAFLDNNQIYVPSQPPQVVSLWPETITSSSGEVTQTPAYSSLGPILIYFLVVIVILGIVLFPKKEYGIPASIPHPIRTPASFILRRLSGPCSIIPKYRSGFTMYFLCSIK